MPYINQKRRRILNTVINEFFKAEFSSLNLLKGDINYIITKIVHKFVLQHGENYNARSLGKSILQDALDEYKRQVMDKYEDKKKQENSAISSLDGITLEDVR